MIRDYDEVKAELKAEQEELEQLRRDYRDQRGAIEDRISELKAELREIKETDLRKLAEWNTIMGGVR